VTDWDPDIDWLLNESAGALGERSAHASQVAQIERGGPSASTVGDTMTDAQLDAARRQRRLLRWWRRVGARHQTTLVAHYTCSISVTKALGVAGALGPLAGVVLAQAERRQSVVDACQRRDERVLGGLRKRAEVAIRRAHEAWREAKTEAARAAMEA
jgi:hypothetical protein